MASEPAAATRPLPWRVEKIGFVFRVLDRHNCEVCQVDVRCYPSEDAARFAAETIVRAAATLEHAVDYVDDIGDCVFCTLTGTDVAVKHEHFCPLAEVP